MTHKKIIKRKNGDTVRIEVKFYDYNNYKDHHGNIFRYEVDVTIRLKGEKAWDYEDTAATPDEIHTAKLELWELLKPIK